MADEKKEEGEHHSLVSILMIGLKLTLLIGLFGVAVRAHVARKKKFGIVAVILLCWITLMIGLVIYEFFYQSIMLLYIIISLSITLTIFQSLLTLRRLSRFIDEDTFKRHSLILLGLTVWSFLHVFIAFLPRVGAHCDQTNLAGLQGNVYPPCFTFSFLVFLTFYAHLTYMTCNGNFMDEERIEEEFSRQAEQFNLLLNQQEQVQESVDG